LARETVKKYLAAAGDLGTLINPVTGRRQVVWGLLGFARGAVAKAQ
jgi:hypothetical protein